MTTELFTEFGLVIIIAALVALLMRVLRQPLIIGHIITGLIVGPLALNIIHNSEIFTLFSEIGIAFLLFTVGLNLNPHVLKEYGKVALVTGVGQVLLSTLIGLIALLLLGISLIPALYISIALAFSSTIIILKLVLDKGDIEKLYTKIAIGFLLVQDVIAIILLFSIPVIASGTDSVIKIAALFLRAIALTIGVFLFAKFILGKMHKYVERSSEFLFLVANAWGLGIAVLFKEFGFSLETGALIAGISLASIPSRQEINARLTPLRDFFIVLFFVVLGSNMMVGDMKSVIVPAIIISLVVLIGKPLILMSIMGFMGYRRRTSMQTGFAVAQISEFSLILIALGVSLGHINQKELSLVTLTGLITVFISTYLILYSERLHKHLNPYLKIFERKKLVEKKNIKKEYDFILFGGNRIGFDFIQMFRRKNGKFVVIDHDPEIIEQLKKEKINYEFGDASDVDFLSSLNLKNAELIVSTIPDFDINMLIVAEGKPKKKVGPTIMTVAHSITNALKLYDAGVAYVILPHFLGGKHASEIAKKFIQAAKNTQEIRHDHIKYLERRKVHGQEHPVIERYR
ncbi:MAG: sodium:proton exchanger [Candidatus Harrisonbacteria bacterium CG10_big_fil_rev_8_21_14_0_10_40_38]|uniref:Sodium:proton exchanger n=1 Tax=Candidatus Harrisonbacteria bacterium CG10_big_fil_rev_8_21_14_0_10_40_38 TaxID=1974583 RepID=A0A2H0US93_9BACT|nr:MAG: sodium:proton exchanger [Candidatus Harrisonbacteria bacterium CG10_big_fil_rev_8_21_14_0_10_40_38]